MIHGSLADVLWRLAETTPVPVVGLQMRMSVTRHEQEQ